MAQGTSLDRPCLFASIHRILMTSATARVKRYPAFRHIPLRLRLMTVVTVFRLIFPSCRMVTGGAVHALEGGMHLMHEGHDPHFITIKIENFLAGRNLFLSHSCGTNQQHEDC